MAAQSAPLGSKGHSAVPSPGPVRQQQKGMLDRDIHPSPEKRRDETSALVIAAKDHSDVVYGLVPNNATTLIDFLYSNSTNEERFSLLRQHAPLDEDGCLPPVVHVTSVIDLASSVRSYIRKKLVVAKSARSGSE